MNLGTKHISSCSHGSLGRNHCIPGISFNVGSLLPSIQPLAQFCFPWFQLPGVNCGPEAGDPPSDTWSEGPNTTSQRLYPSPHYLSRYHLPSSQGGEAAQDWRNITWEENECSKRSLRENKNKTREIKILLLSLSASSCRIPKEHRQCEQTPGPLIVFSFGTRSHPVWGT
ncbi:uncharacterized protein LOC144616142 isoform X1 [Panthera onca]